MTTVYASSGKDFWGDIVYPLDKGGLTGKMVWAEKMLIRNGYLVEFIYGVLLQDKTDVALCKELYQSYKTNVDILHLELGLNISVQILSDCTLLPVRMVSMSTTSDISEMTIRALIKQVWSLSSDPSYYLKLGAGEPRHWVELSDDLFVGLDLCGEVSVVDLVPPSYTSYWLERRTS